MAAVWGSVNVMLRPMPEVIRSSFNKSRRDMMAPPRKKVSKKKKKKKKKGLRQAVWFVFWSSYSTSSLCDECCIFLSTRIFQMDQPECVSHLSLGRVADNEQQTQQQQSDSVDNDEPYLPLELIAFHIFPHAFDTPREAASLSLVCRFVHECQLLRRGSFWMAWLERQRDALLEYVRNELRLPDEQTAFEGLKACIESRFNATPLLKHLGVDGMVHSVLWKDSLYSIGRKGKTKEQKHECVQLDDVDDLLCFFWKVLGQRF
jgi:hypothetical protein